MMNEIRRTIAWLLLGLLAAFPAFAQPADDAPAFGEAVDVRVINLEVVVTDGKDRVTGLRSEDFQLLVNGEEMPIDYFTEVWGGQAVSSDTLAEAAPAGAAAVPSLEPGEAVGRRILVFIDDVFTIKGQRNRVLRGLLEQLTLLGPEDRMAVVAFDGKTIELLSSWIGSIPEIESVFAKASDRPSHGLLRRLDRRSDPDQDPLEHSGAPGDFGPSIYSGAVRGSKTYALVDGVIEAATSTLRGFAQAPGRKVMLLISGGWPTDPYAYSSPGSVSIPSGGEALYSDRDRLAPLVDTANRLGYTLYPVDVKGVENRFLGGDLGQLGRDAGEAEYFRDTARAREWTEEGVLMELAWETGGKAFLDGARGTALGRVVEDTRSYYSIGFTPTWQENDQRHRVKVKVLRRGLKARSRKSFTDLSRQSEMTMRVESAQLFDLPLPSVAEPSAAELGVTFGETVDEGGKKVLVPLEVEIPLDQVKLLQDAGGWSADLELRVAVTDNRGDRSDIAVVPVPIRRPTAPAAGDTLLVDVGLRMRKRPHRLLISVSDQASETMLSKEVDLTF